MNNEDKKEEIQKVDEIFHTISKGLMNLGFELCPLRAEDTGVTFKMDCHQVRLYTHYDEHLGIGQLFVTGRSEEVKNGLNHSLCIETIERANSYCSKMEQVLENPGKYIDFSGRNYESNI